MEPAGATLDGGFLFILGAYRAKNRGYQCVAQPKSTNNPLDRIVGSEWARLKSSKKSNLADLPLFDFLTTVSPHLRRPEHLADVLPHLERMEREPGNLCFSAPPRHGKSILINHLVAQRMIKNPGLRVAYGSYSLDLSAGFFSSEVKDILSSSGIEVDKTSNAKEFWRLKNGSSFKSVAPGSGFTGRGADLIVIDDPYKSRADFESGRIRESTWSWFTSVAITRRSPNASVILTHTRWGLDDLIGRVTDKHGWPLVNLQALDNDGSALWPGEWPSEKLDEIRNIIGLYDWNSLYQGNPTSRGGSVFSGTNTYDDEDLAKDPIVKHVIGIDLAYTAKTSSDFSVAVVLGIAKSGRAYIVDVRRAQCEAPDFAKVLLQLRKEYDSPPIYWFTGGTERSVADLFRDSFGIPIKVMPAKADKFVRAQAAAAAWNSGKILVPSETRPWTNYFLGEVLTFTGQDDTHDDNVDALAAAYTPLAGKKTVRGHLTSQILEF